LKKTSEVQNRKNVKLQKVAWLWFKCPIIFLIVHNDRTSILFGKLECILKLRPCTTKGVIKDRVKNENKKISVVKRTNIKKKKSEEPCACWLQPTKNNNTSQL